LSTPPKVATANLPLNSGQAVPDQKRYRPAARATGATARRTVITPIAGLLIAVALAIGVAAGVFFTRRYYRAKKILVSVNGQNLEDDAYYKQLESVVGMKVMRQMIEDTLVLQFAARKHALPTDAEVDARYAQESAKPQFAENLAASGKTPDMLKAHLRVLMAKANLVTAGMTVTDADIRRFYALNSDPKNPTAQFYTPETAQVAVIITKTQERANEAMNQLANGIPFATVASNFSIDTSKRVGGQMPSFPRGRTSAAKVPGLEDTIFNMKIGERRGPVHIANTWWIIDCLKRTPAITIPFAKAASDARYGAMVSKGMPVNSKKVDAEFDEFRKAAKIQPFWDRYKEVVKTN
jgi:parvulin-like peptidyl-prolyl isomerase